VNVQLLYEEMCDNNATCFKLIAQGLRQDLVKGDKLLSLFDPSSVQTLAERKRKFKSLFSTVLDQVKQDMRQEYISWIFPFPQKSIDQAELWLATSET
jgi:hypothetical protein